MEKERRVKMLKKFSLFSFQQNEYEILELYHNLSNFYLKWSKRHKKDVLKKSV